MSGRRGWRRRRRRSIRCAGGSARRRSGAGGGGGPMTPTSPYPLRPVGRRGGINASGVRGGGGYGNLARLGLIAGAGSASVHALAVADWLAVLVLAPLALVLL